MRHKEFVITRLEAQMNLIQNLQKSIDANIISKTDALKMLSNIQSNINLVVERLELEHNE